MINGSVVALVTPMLHDGSVDKRALEDLVEWHIAAKTDAIVAVGTTGESATLDASEQLEVISIVVKQVQGRIPVIAGTGTNSTKSTLKLTEQAKAAGVDATLIVTPYYNKPSQGGLFAHYQAIAKAIDIPIILYNVPTRTSCDLLPDTIEKLSTIPNIIGVKEATGKLDRALDIKSRCDNSFAIYSGDDASALELMLHGAKGVISVTANVAPAKMHDMCEAALKGNKELALEINETLIPLHNDLFIESNPVPVKWALQKMGKIASGIRMPLLPLEQKNQPRIIAALQHAGVI